MTHEFKNIVKESISANQNGVRTVLASVVDLDGSSYRRPGVRMLILENGKMIGAVSGGCVEKEILLQSETVFKTGVSKMMTYDGRYRLGCEGVLFILIEVFQPNKAFVNAFFNCLRNRTSFQIVSQYKKQEGIFSNIGSKIKIGNTFYAISQTELNKKPSELYVFKQNMPPCFKLIIIGAEHDAVQLCKLASFTGWEVTIITGISESKSIKDFPEATAFYANTPEQINTFAIDIETAIVLMTHNFANDLRYLVALKNTNPSYIGLLGPARRRDDLLSQFMEYCPEVNLDFLDRIHGPAGINIGSETPQEIAISVVSEILSVIRKQEPISLSKKTGRIHTK
jgi:xanthine/CO dehydrogenase XdhC/CoxF family maturation factor